MPFDLDIQVESIESKIILRLDGRIDAVTTPALGKKIQILVEENHKKILLDFAKVDYLSSAGLRLILSTTKKLKAAGGFLVLFSINEDIYEIIKMAGFEKILHICKMEREALQFG